MTYNIDGIPVDASSAIPIPREFAEMLISASLREHFRHINLLKPGEVSGNVPDVTFTTNEGFWQSFIRGRHRALEWVRLEGFQVVDWYPRAPGVFHTDFAQDVRTIAKDYVRSIDDIMHYLPRGKTTMILGGIGAVRF
jgi:hypothetical protein